MLPYHLKPPAYGVKLRKEKDSKSLLERQHPLRGGGPFQRAIEADLLALRREFATRLQRRHVVHEDESTTNHHIPTGTAFHEFQTCFASAKVALLHTRLQPPATDAAAYSQLIYASCWSLLRKAFIDGPDNDDDGDGGISSSLSVVDRASYALFQLYALFETNPLPVVVATHNTTNKNNATKQQLELLPMGVQSLESPRIVFRRSFRPPIRIDLEHYAYLMRLRDLALAATARCEQHRLEINHHMMTPCNDTDEKHHWTCCCAVAADVPIVIAKLLPHLDFCAYTGPCSLQGLAGHADYSVPPTPATQKWLQTNMTTTTTHEAAVAPTTVVRTPPQLESLGHDDDRHDPYVVSDQTRQALEEYRTHRKSIRLPPDTTQQSHRVREALMPMFSTTTRDDDDPWTDLLAHGRGEPLATATLLSKTIQRVQFRHAVPSFGAVTILTNTAATNNETTSVASRSTACEGARRLPEKDGVLPNNQGNNDNNVTFDLVLPKGLPLALEESVKAAVETLLTTMDERLFLPATTVTDPNHEALHAAAANDMSTLGGRGVSVATSTANTGVGQRALDALLARVTNASAEEKSIEHNSVWSANTHQGRNALSALLAKAAQFNENRGLVDNAVDQPKQQLPGEAFLDTDSYTDQDDTDNTTARGKATDYVSELSSEEELASVTGSTVGRAALRDLLAIAGKQQQRKRRKPENKRSTAKEIVAKKKQARKPSPRKRRRHSKVNKAAGDTSRYAPTPDPAEESSSSSSNDDDSSSLSETGSAVEHGRTALTALLQRASV